MKVLDHITTRLDRFSVWLRWRWNRSHYEVSAVLIIVSASAMLMFNDPPFAKGFLLFLFLVGLVIAVARAQSHNKPASVGGWNFLSDIALRLQLFFMVMALSASLLTLDPARLVAAISAPLAFILLDFPGRKVEHEPPAQGKFASQSGF